MRCRRHRLLLITQRCWLRRYALRCEARPETAGDTEAGPRFHHFHSHTARVLLARWSSLLGRRPTRWARAHKGANGISATQDALYCCCAVLFWCCTRQVRITLMCACRHSTIVLTPLLPRLLLQAFLKRAWPRLEAWYSWFNTSQAGQQPGSYM
jgi:hypothetical protein